MPHGMVPQCWSSGEDHGGDWFCLGLATAGMCDSVGEILGAAKGHFLTLLTNGAWTSALCSLVCTITSILSFLYALPGKWGTQLMSWSK